MKLPTKKYNYFNDYINDGWKLDKSCKLRKKNGKFYLDFYLEKDCPEVKTSGKSIGLDCGYSTDADYNASVNILQREIYSSSPTKNVSV